MAHLKPDSDWLVATALQTPFVVVTKSSQMFGEATIHVIRENPMP